MRYLATASPIALAAVVALLATIACPKPLELENDAGVVTCVRHPVNELKASAGNCPFWPNPGPAPGDAVEVRRLADGGLQWWRLDHP
jgi:hypothetical protein